MPEPTEIPEHERMVDAVMHKAKPGQVRHKPIKSLAEAREAEHGAVVIEGDWGGTVYLSCPVKYVRATEEEIKVLAEWLERQFWDCNFLGDGEGGHGVYYKDAPPGTGIWGGMGGGCHVDGLWVHPDLVEGEGDDVRDEIIKRLKLEKTNEDPVGS